jgi:hypothetical protein
MACVQTKKHIGVHRRSGLFRLGPELVVSIDG